MRKKLRVRVQQRLQIQLLALEYPASGETQDRPGSVLVQTSGHVDDDVQLSALDAFVGVGGRKSRYIGEVLVGIEEKMPEISREENQMNRQRN